MVPSVRDSILFPAFPALPCRAFTFRRFATAVRVLLALLQLRELPILYYFSGVLLNPFLQELTPTPFGTPVVASAWGFTDLRCKLFIFCRSHSVHVRFEKF